LNRRLSFQDLKNEEYDKVAEFIKDFKLKQNECGSNQKRDMELLKGAVSKVQSRQDSSDDEMERIKGRVIHVESKILENQHHIVNRQNSITTKSSITNRIQCTPKSPCAYDFKGGSRSAASSDKITSTSPSPKSPNSLMPSKMSEDHHHIAKRQNFITTKPSITNRIQCTPKSPCAYDFKDAASLSAASSDNKITSTSPSPNNHNNSLIPSSCKDLSTNGHTSNGIYLLYDSNVKKVSTAFCDFTNNNKGI